MCDFTFGGFNPKKYNRLFQYILFSGIAIFLPLKFRCLRRELDATRLLLLMPEVVEGDYEVFVSPK